VNGWIEPKFIREQAIYSKDEPKINQFVTLRASQNEEFMIEAMKVIVNKKGIMNELDNLYLSRYPLNSPEDIRDRFRYYFSQSGYSNFLYPLQEGISIPGSNGGSIHSPRQSSQCAQY
jgi:hypothetical protein